MFRQPFRRWFSSSSTFPVRRFSDNADKVPENYKSIRLKQLKAAGIEPYPGTFRVTCSVRDILEKYEGVKAGETVDKPTKVAGIITNIRESGKKLKFIDLLSNGCKLQLKLHAQSFSDPEQFNRTTGPLRRGDRIGVEGSPCRTKAGQLSIDCKRVTLLSPCLHIIPTNTIENTTKRLSRRYLDILVNPTLRDTLVSRTRIIRSLRSFLEHRDFMEVETPILGNSIGGASATPFLTYHKEMKTNLYMRIAPELYLKQLVIAGFDRVFEIGKLFRNEGIDSSHNPEFTSCEFYMAYADYTDLMELTNTLFSQLCKEHNFKPRVGSVDLDFTRPYERLEFLPSLEQALDTKLPDLETLGTDDTLKFLTDLCERRNIPISAPITVPRLLDKLLSALVEPNLVQPTFITHHPMVMSPLSRPSATSPALAERFELYAAGLEICNAYSELNDPEIQRRTLLAQAGLADPEAMIPDEGFCTALEYGLPPTAGWGCGLDRLTAILTNTANIRETITFPLIKPVYETAPS